MKILPVIKNVEWTNNYQDVPYLINVNKEVWLLKNYLGNSNLNLWDNVKDKKSLVNTDRINATLIVNLKDLKEQLPNLYDTWNIYNLLAVNYFIGNEGQFYFVKKGTGATLTNATTVSFELELDSWMTNIHDKITNDNKERYIRKGHANRLINTSGDKYELDFDRANPNWNEISGPKPVKEIIGKGFFSSEFDIDLFKRLGTTANPNKIIGKTEVYKLLNEFNWLVLLSPLPKDADSKIDYKQGVKVKSKDGTLSFLPYQLLVAPLYEFTNEVESQKTILGIERLTAGGGRDWVLGDALNGLGQTGSELLNAGVIKGIVKGCDIFPGADHDDIKCEWIKSNKENRLEFTFPDKNLYNIDKVATGLLIINEIEYNENPNGIFKILENSFFENNLLDFPSQKLNKDFKNELGNIFNKEWDKTNLEPTNDKNIELESSLYNPQILGLKLNATQQAKEISYQLLKGKQPTLSHFSSYAESIETTRKVINEGYYVDYEYDIKENIVGSSQNNYPLGSTKYQDFLLQQQSQHQASMVSAGVGTAISSITSLLGIIGGIIAGPLTGGLSTAATIGTIGLGVSQVGSAAQSGLSVNEKKAQITDLKNQPSEIRNTGSNIINTLATDLTVQNDYLVIEKPVASDLKYFYDEVYENGVNWDFRYSVRFDSRFWFNYWQIIDIHKTLDLTGLNPDEISLVDSIFENGIRLWHIRNATQTLDTSKFGEENLEMEIYEN